jgi:hypothetical protein
MRRRGHPVSEFARVRLHRGGAADAPVMVSLSAHAHHRAVSAGGADTPGETAHA